MLLVETPLPEGQQVTSQVRLIPCDRILPNPEQPRKHFEQDALMELAISIQENGLLQPIVVEEEHNGFYILQAGERRLRATRMAGHSHIEAIVRPQPVGSKRRTRLVNALIENVHREALNPIEEAHAIQQMLRAEMTIAEIAARLGWNEVTVQSRLQLLLLEEELQVLVASGDLPRDGRATKALLSLPDSDARIKLGQRLARPGITIQAIIGACERLNERIRQEQHIAQGNTPALTLSGPLPTTASQVRWPVIRAAAHAMCDTCDANPNLEGISEPAWSLIITATEQTCAACSLRETARHTKLAVCQNCPGVELLRRLIGSTREDR